MTTKRCCSLMMESYLFNKIKNMNQLELHTVTTYISTQASMFNTNQPNEKHTVFSYSFVKKLMASVTDFVLLAFFVCLVMLHFAPFRFVSLQFDLPDSLSSTGSGPFFVSLPFFTACAPIKKRIKCRYQQSSTFTIQSQLPLVFTGYYYLVVGHAHHVFFNEILQWSMIFNL